VLILLLNYLLDKQGTVLCSMLCVYFCKGTLFQGLRGPKMNGRDGCSLNLAIRNTQQEILLFETTYRCFFNLGYFNVPVLAFLLNYNSFCRKAMMMDLNCLQFLFHAFLFITYFCITHIDIFFILSHNLLAGILGPSRPEEWIHYTVMCFYVYSIIWV